MQHSVECGFYRVAETTVFHYAGYECAAWWRDTRVEAGDYPVVATLRGGTLEFHVDLPGTIVADSFQSLWGGVAFGRSYDTTQNAGKPSSYLIQARDYVVFGSMRSESSNWKIDVSKLPVELAKCADCSGYIRAGLLSDLCPSCAVERTKQLQEHARRRHRFLLSTAYGLRTSRESSYLDRVIAEAGHESNMQDFYTEILRKEIAAMRTAGPSGRIVARASRPVPSYAFPL